MWKYRQCHNNRRNYIRRVLPDTYTAKARKMVSNTIMFALLLAISNAAGLNSDCLHVLINSQCWLKKCPDETTLQCGSVALNISTLEFGKFASVHCELNHRELPSKYIKEKVLPNVYSVNFTSECDGLCSMLKNG